MLCRFSSKSASRFINEVLTNNCSRCSQPRRWKKKWVTAESSALKNDPSRLALNHFDQQYRAQFKEAWPSVRLALLSLQKYGALINNFSDADEVTQQLSGLGAQDFVQPMAEELRGIYAEAELKLLAKKKAKLWQNDRSNVDEYANDEDEFTNDLTDDSDRIHGTVKFQNRLNEAEDLENESEELEKNPSNQRIGRNKIEYDDGDVEVERSKENPSWKDKYIVAAGYESKLEYMIGQERLAEQDDSFEALSVEATQIPIGVDPSLRCFVHPVGKFVRFPPSKLDPGSHRLLYFTLDASSLLPVLALDIQPSDSVLDMCAAPGGKSLAMVNILEKGGIVLNEPSTPRRRRLQSVLDSYVPQEILNSGKIQVTSVDGEQWGQTAPDTFDKILVDVPCTTDRLSLKEKDNNIFTAKRNKERWDLPSLQEKLLCSALLAVKPGGDVVYSTCTLSSLQNDGVVQGAILRCQEEYDMVVEVIDLSPLASCSSSVFKFSNTSRYGQLVIPELNRNFGPMYFARLRKSSGGGEHSME